MEQVELLTVKDSFYIRGRGLVGVPDFSIPDGWVNQRESVVVIRPDGHADETLAEFSITHFELSDPTANADKRWRVVITLPQSQKNNVPLGSKILVSTTLRNALLPSSL